MADYPKLLVANLISRNPLGASFDTILKRIDSLSATDRTEVPASYIQLASGAATATSGTSLPPFTVSVGKPELLLLTAHLRVIRSFVQYLGSVDLNYPLGQSFLDAIHTARANDANKNGIDDSTEAIYASTPGLYHTTLLQSRNDSPRASSRDSFVATLKDVSSSMDLYSQAASDPTSNYAAYLALYFPNQEGAGLTASSLLSMVTPVVQNLKAQADLLQAAVMGNPPINLADEVLHPTLSGSDPLGIVRLLSGSVDSTKFHTAMPGAIWANNVMDLRFWFKNDPTTGFPMWFVRNGYASSSTVSGGVTTSFTENDFAFPFPSPLTGAK
jgi:hypothetical protein